MGQEQNGAPKARQLRRRRTTRRSGEGSSGPH